jgi:hypothetical protein
MGMMSQFDFISWCEKTKKTFLRLHKQWEKSGFVRKLTPSIDRINNRKGYVLGNIRWITQERNCRKYTK